MAKKKKTKRNYRAKTTPVVAAASTTAQPVESPIVTKTTKPKAAQTLSSDTQLAFISHDVRKSGYIFILCLILELLLWLFLRSNHGSAVYDLIKI